LIGGSNRYRTGTYRATTCSANLYTIEPIKVTVTSSRTSRFSYGLSFL